MGQAQPERLRVYSWNVCRSNRRLKEALEFIRETAFDLFCLQEVSDAFLAELRALPYQLISAVEVVRRHPNGSDETNHSVILVSPECHVTGSGQVGFPDADSRSLRTRMFVKAMRPFGWLPSRERGGAYVDISVGVRNIRIFSLHLTLKGPAARMEQLQAVAATVPERSSAIIAGDLNTSDRPLARLMSFFLGGSLNEMLSARRERDSLNGFFSAAHLKNPLDKKVTHGLAGTQLDYVLVPGDSTVLEADVVKDTHGSDHHPVSVALRY